MMLSPAITFAFAVVMALSSVTLAVAQHGPIGAMTLVLCSDAGDLQITVDAQGNPVPLSQVCPDCVAGMAAQAVPAAHGLQICPLTARLLHTRLAPSAESGSAATPPCARGPPMMI